MHILRFILPFLFVRNWHDGSWEISQPRLLLFCTGILFFIMGLCAVYFLQAPIVYIAPTA